MSFIHYLERITGVGIYPLISLCVFFIFFTVLVLWVWKADKGYLKNMQQIPFSGNENE